MEAGSRSCSYQHDLRLYVTTYKHTYIYYMHIRPAEKLKSEA